MCRKREVCFPLLNRRAYAAHIQKARPEAAGRAFAVVLIRDAYR